MPVTLDDRASRLLELMREADAEAVTLDELQIAGIPDPALALRELELAGIGVERVYDRTAHGAAVACVRLARATLAAGPPAVVGAGSHSDPNVTTDRGPTAAPPPAPPTPRAVVGSGSHSDPNVTTDRGLAAAPPPAPPTPRAVVDSGSHSDPKPTTDRGSGRPGPMVVVALLALLAAALGVAAARRRACE